MNTNKIPEKKCIICGKLYIPERKSRWEKSKYCSLDCLNKSKFKGKYIKCKICNKEVWTEPSEIKKKYCSKKCHNIALARTSKGKNNPNWKDGICVTPKKLAGVGKGNAGYRKGKYYERKTRKILEKEGYYTIRSAASKGVWDIVAIREDNVKLIQVKAGTSARKKQEIENMRQFKVPIYVSKELWFFYNPRKPPKIDIIERNI